MSGMMVLLMLMGSASAQSFSVVYDFKGTAWGDGGLPNSALTADSAGNLYGTTSLGGKYDFGTVFELPVSGGEKILHHFTGGWDGGYPGSALALDPSGNVYGTTWAGGNLLCGDIGCGVVFRLSPQGIEKVLHTFTGNDDGAFPLGGVIRDSTGNLYGTASGGGTQTGDCAGFLGCGVVFKLDTASHMSTLYRFSGAPDGLGPANSLTRDAAGNLYGTTRSGGDTACGLHGCGVVFKLDGNGRETVLHAFGGGSDGTTPDQGPLPLDAASNLYGTTAYGGDLGCTLYSAGCGVVFKLDPTGNETVLYTFHGAADGGFPFGGVILDSKGNLYGTASAGGTTGGSCFTSGCGVVFKLSPSGEETVLHSFQFTDGDIPSGTLLLHKGYLYGTAAVGGHANPAYDGTVFRLRP